MHAISSYRGNRPTHIQTHPPTHKQTGPITIHCAAASVQCNQYCGLIHYLTHPSIFKQYKLADAGTSLWCTKFNNQAISLNDVLISRLLTIPDSGYCLYAYKELHGAASKHPIRAKSVCTPLSVYLSPSSALQSTSRDTTHRRGRVMMAEQ